MSHVIDADNDLGTEEWCKPWSGSNGGACFEVKQLPEGKVAIRQSTQPGGPALVFPGEAVRAFVEGAKGGDADFLLSR
ncbi:DUF397 domain-containing protein [Streptomyces aureocirculatus]|uniref:DUF397 domain-containing protein n=1 Tax=Streptomyces aureocirculatus TaxID=67275 RepID=UPI0004C61D73|nr:DUF397 domain-containing protein [Streptomyces aureocirculatus]